MIIVGNDYIKYDTFEVIETIEDIQQTSPNSVVVFHYDLPIMSYCFSNNIPFALFVNSIKDAVFANNLGARYLIVEECNSSALQKIAEQYIFDSKILVIVDSDDMIETVAKNGIDGVIYNKFLEGLKK